MSHTIASLKVMTISRVIGLHNSLASSYLSAPVSVSNPTDSRVGIRYSLVGQSAIASQTVREEGLMYQNGFK